MAYSTRICIGLTFGFGLALHGNAAANLVVNGGFEDGFNSWQWFGVASNTASLSDDTPTGSGFSADLDINEVLGLPWLVQDVPVNAGDELTFAAWVREVEPFRPDVDAWIAAQVWMLENSDSGNILNSNFALFSNPNWERQSFEITVPPTATIARVLFTPQDPDFGVGTGQYRIDDVSLVAAMAGLAGDYNDDGHVLAADYPVWRDNLGAPAGTLPNDSDGGEIGPAQYATWKSNYGMPAGSGSAGQAAVPEPSSLWLLALVTVGLVSRSCRTLLSSR